MDKQEFNALRKIIANAPRGATHYLVNQYDFTEGFFKLNDKLDVLVDGPDGWKEIDFDVSINGNHVVQEIANITTIIEQHDRIKPLITFIGWVLDAVVGGSDICGGDAQDKMHELGILTREIYNPEIHMLQQGSECEAGDYIYFKVGEL